MGDIVRIINDCGCNAYGLVGVIESVDPKSVDVTCDDIKLSCLYEWIEPYTEPETKPTEDMDTKEKESGEKGNNPQNSQLDLCELLKGRCTTFYSPMWGDTDVLQLYDVNLRIAPCKNHDSWLNTDEQGKCDDDGICMLWPSRALYEQYPLDPYTAWMKWQEEQNKYSLSLSIVGNDLNGRIISARFRTPTDRDKCIEEIKAIIEKYSKKL